MSPEEPNSTASLPLCGLVNIDKPAGLSSRDVVNRIEKAAGKIKVGHAGTLDPIASGVLVLCVGPATRLIEYVQRMHKEYRGTFLLGQSSPSDDIETELESLKDAPVPSRAELEAAAGQFGGHIEQRPPAFSAVKIQGQRAYKRARKGQDVEMPLRTVRIDAVEIVEYDYPKLVLDIRCGSGTYVRSLGRDLAQAVGSAAVMSDLVRTAIGKFTVENASHLDDVWPESFADHLLPPLHAIAELPQIEVDDRQIEEIRNGRLIDCDSPAEELAAVDRNGQLIAIMVPRDTGKIGPRCNFVR